jgi:hypothetical protein
MTKLYCDWVSKSISNYRFRFEPEYKIWFYRTDNGQWIYDPGAVHVQAEIRRLLSNKLCSWGCPRVHQVKESLGLMTMDPTFVVDCQGAGTRSLAIVRCLEALRNSSQDSDDDDWGYE